MQRLFPLLILFLVCGVAAGFAGYSTAAGIVVLTSLILASLIGGAGPLMKPSGQSPKVRVAPGAQTLGQNLVAIEAKARGEPWTPPVTDFDDQTIESGRRRAGPSRIE